MAEQKKAPGSNTKLLAEKLDDIHETLLDIREDLEELRPPSGLKRSTHAFVQGVFRGLGFVFATTILVTIIVFALQQLLRTEAAQTWITNRVTNILDNSVQAAIEQINFF